MEKDHMLRVTGPLWKEIVSKSKDLYGKKPADLARDYLIQGVLGVKPTQTKGTAKEKNKKKTSMVVCEYNGDIDIRKTKVISNLKDIDFFKTKYGVLHRHTEEVDALLEIVKIEPGEEPTEEQIAAAIQLQTLKRGPVVVQPRSVDRSESQQAMKEHGDKIDAEIERRRVKE